MFSSPYNNVGIFKGLNTTGERIKHARLMKHMTIAELSLISGISVSTLSYVENEKTTLSLPYLNKLSIILKKPISYLGCYENLPSNTMSEKILKTRLFLGLTKKEFGQIIGVNEKTVAAWEDNRQQPIDINVKLLKTHFKILKSS